MVESVQCEITIERTNLREKEAALADEYERRPLTRNYLRGRRALVDAAIKALWQSCSLPTSYALVATGGYGRGELFPHSDVDLLVLLTGKPGADEENALQCFVGALWDIGLQIGHSVRTIDECVDVAAHDVTIQTNLLETRLVAGNRKLLRALDEAMRAALDVDRFFKAKQLEQEQRYARFADSPYTLEPNCKESPGGLRDVQMLGWLSRAAGLGRHWRDLVRRRLITAEEANELRSAERLLQHIRIRLHLLTGRGEDRLLFDHQEALARAFGIKATKGKRAAEIFMQRYYRAAKKVVQLNTLLLLSYSDEFSAGPHPAALYINDNFQSIRNRIDIRDEDLFEREPSAMFEVFELLQQRSELDGMTARTLRAMWINRRRVDAAFRADPVNRRRFISLLRAKRGVVRSFRRMNQSSLLSNYLPSWRKISCQMQHDLFHVYTVDLHTLMVIRNLRRFTMGEHVHEYPLMSQLMLAFEDHWLLYVAALFHDIAKGRGGDHSELGMVDARQFCEQHEIGADDTDLVVWLVGNHLAMSRVAQKADISDPDVVQRFAEAMGSERRLTALYLLTHADIRGTSPKVWNAWKSRLLEDLFHAARRLLRGASATEALGLDDRERDAERLLRYQGLPPGVEDALWSKLDPVYFMRHSPDEIAWHTSQLLNHALTDPPVVRARLSDDGEGVQVMVFTRDERDLFVRLCAFFGALDYTILDAKVHTTRHGYALDSFIVEFSDAHTSSVDHVAVIERELSARFAGNMPIDRPPTARLSRHVRHFPLTPVARLRADESGNQHILTITAADRPGLLFDIAATLARHRIVVHTAKIGTLGERVEDTFLVSGAVLRNEKQVVLIERELIELLQI